ncbi:MAG: response regulator [Phycisphaerales bacterium]
MIGLLSLSPPNSRSPFEQDIKRVLLVEDEFLVALSIKTMLENMGFEVIGPAASIEDAMRMLDDAAVDAAVLDINIIGGTSVPIARLLQVQSRPFVFVTGYQSPSHLLPNGLKSITRLTKPVEERALSAALRSAMP